MIDGQPYSFFMYEQILKEQLLIAYLSKGAITVTETNDMPIHDRKLLLNTLRQAEEEKKKKLEELKKTRAMRKHKR
jgi:predicted transposase YdaD